MDDGGYMHTINFSHTTDISIYVRIAITTTPEFSGDAAKDEIRDNIRMHINNVGVGNSLILSALYGLIHSVDGVKEVTAVLLSSNGTAWNFSNIDVTAHENCIFEQLEINQNGGGYEVID